MSNPWRRADWVICIPMVILLLIGLIMIFSTSSVVGQSNFNNSYYFIQKHSIFIAIGMVAFFVGFVIPHQVYKEYSLTLLLMSSGLIVLTLIPGIGVKIAGASRWLNVGFTSIQPVEVLKFAVVVFLSSALAHKKDMLGSIVTGLVPIAVVLLVPILLLAMQPDLGNIGVILLVSGTLLFLSHVPLKHIVVMALSSVFFVAMSIIKNPYQMVRVKSFLSPWADPYGKNYHLVQSLIAIGSGGFWGRGIGESKLKFFYLPLQYSDFIFSIICEEGGFILATLIIVMYGFLFFRGVRIARYSTSLFSYYLCIGLVLLLVVQAMINIAVVIGMMPVTGIPLTFISFGGTSLITSLFFMGVIMNISLNETLTAAQR